jgi:hypothetical protein
MIDSDLARKSNRLEHTYPTSNIQHIQEKHASREIPSLEINGTVITNPEEIVRVMQDWYENTAQTSTLQTTSLQQFTEKHNIALPQPTEDQKELLSVEFSHEEIEEALKEAKEHSALARPDKSSHSTSSSS